MLSNKRRSLLAKRRKESGHLTFSNRPIVEGRPLNTSSQNNTEIKEYRKSTPGSNFSNWRSQSRSLTNQPKPVLIEPNFSHLNDKNRRRVENLWWSKTRENRTLRNPKMAQYLANIQSKYNNPLDMKNAVQALNTITSNQKNELIKNIDSLYPVENYYNKSRGLGHRYLTRKNVSGRAKPENWDKLNKTLATVTY